MIVNGFALNNISTGEQVAWWETIPPRIDLPDDGIVLFGALPDWSNDKYQIVAATSEFPDPPAVRQLIAKSLILDRLTDAQLAAALTVMTERQKEKWRMPGTPNVYVDDPDLLAVLQAISADPAVVLAAAS